MANEADKVVIELLARVDGFDGKIRQSASSFGASMKTIGQSAEQAERTVTKSARQQQAEVKRLENQIRGSSNQISSTLRGLAASFATYFSAREVIAITDSYTRFQNSLRVAGLEGQNLADVQERLFASGQKYGVQIETLGQLYGRASQAASTLGASQEDLLKFTDNISATVKVQGGSVQEASGALLQLSQALQGGTVRAEEFNSINEGLFPVLQAVAAGSDKFGGSVAKLRKAVIDGEVSSKAFFEAFQKGAPILEERAAKAALTTQAAFTQLTNALTKYFGEADKANGASAALGAGIKALADNLDTIIPALAVLATAMGVSYVRGALSAATATGVLRGAMIALSNVTIAAVLLGLGYLATSSQRAETRLAQLGGTLDQAKSSLEQAADRAKRAGVNIDEAGGAAKSAEQPVTGLGIAFKFAADKAAELASNAKLAALASLNLRRTEAQTQADRLRNQLATNQGLQAFGGTRSAGGLISNPALEKAVADNERLVNAKIGELEAVIRLTEQEIKIVGATPESAFKEKPKPADIIEDDKKKKKKGPTAEEIEQRFQDELVGYAQQTLSARASMAKSAEEQAELELRGVELARISTLEGIKNDKDYSAAQKKALSAQVERLAEEERARVEFDKKRRLESEQQALADERFRTAKDQLQVEYDLATTQNERKRLALEMLALEDRHMAAMLEAVIASETVAEAEKERARILLESLEATSEQRQERESQANAGPLESFFQSIPNTADEINEALESVAAGGLATFTDALTDAIVNFSSLKQVGLATLQAITAGLVRMAIQQVILRTIGQTLGSASIAATSAQAAAAGAAWAGPAALASLATLGANAGPAAAALASTTALATALGAVPKKDGGPIFGPGGPRDDKVLMAASPGEYVIKAKSASKLGRAALDRMNLTGELPGGYASGGSIGGSIQPSNAPAAPSVGGKGGGISEAEFRRLEGALTRAAQTMPQVNLYPTLDKAAAFEAMLSDPGAQRIFFNFVSQNSAKFNSQLRR